MLAYGTAPQAEGASPFPSYTPVVIPLPYLKPGTRLAAHAFARVARGGQLA